MVIEPCGPPEDQCLQDNVSAIRAVGLKVDHEPLSMNTRDRLSWEGASTRAAHLQAALLQDASDVLLCARGGYGASELLHLLDWTRIKRSPWKLLVGFSDVTAIQSALYTLAGWPALHGPMPGSPLWGEGPHIDQLLSYFDEAGRMPLRGSLDVDLAEGGELKEHNHQGILFGGCLSVLSGLIGTPYLPSDLSGHILFFEDTGESVSRVLRYWRQWLDSGLLAGVQAIVLGRFTNADGSATDEAWLAGQIAERAPCCVYTCQQFGHIPANYPLMLGARATLSGRRLSWVFDPQLRSE